MNTITLRTLVPAALAVLLATATAAVAQTPVSGATAVATGDLHACAIVNGGVKCWGYDFVGQLGDGAEPEYDWPDPGAVRAIAGDVVGLPAGSNVTALAAGVEHTCAVQDGGLLCWGRNGEGQLGTGIRTTAERTPVPVLGLEPGANQGVTAVSAGLFYTCAVASGAVLCWGDLPDGIDQFVTSPQTLIASGATAVSAGWHHACAVVNGGVRCWGTGDWGQLGHGAQSGSDTPVVAIPDASGATAVAAGLDYTCAIVAGTLKCWGGNAAGQLGNGEMGNGLFSAVPVDVVDFAGTPVRVAAGAGHACAIASGSVQCWGFGLMGELGTGVPGLASSLPLHVVGLPGGSGATDLAAGLYLSCAVVNGGVQCWGYGEFGQLGHDAYTSSAVPVAVVTDNPVSNTAPDLGPVSLAPSALVAAGTGVTASAAFVDPDPSDAHQCRITWGDGTVDTPAPWMSACGASHAYAAAGVYLVTVAVTDASGASDSSTFAYQVVYDPSAGFVTGGGTFDSAPGAYVPDPTLTGRAHFGFVAKYQPGRSTPAGRTEFQFTAAGLTFTSTAYDWLVVAGGKALYKGLGTIDGGGDFAFQLSAVDGQMQGGTDRIRMRIWDRVGGGLVYDNQTCGATDADADPCTALTGGEIVIHTGRK